MAQDEDDRRAILARRKRFIAMALLGTTTAVTGTACVCLSPAPVPPLEYDANYPDAASQDAGPPDGGRRDASSDAARPDGDLQDAASSDAADSEPPDAP